MKRNFLKWMAIAMIGAGLTACSGRQEEGLQTKVCHQEQKLAYSEESEAGLHVKIDVEYVTGGIEEAVKDSINRVIVAAVYGNRYLDNAVAIEADAEDIADVEVATAQFVEDTYKNYQELSTEYREEAVDWEVVVNASFLAPYDHYLSYLVDTYSFEGGAHGMSYKIPVVMDAKTGKVIGEDDIFVENYQEDLGRFLTMHLRDSFESEEDYNSLFTKDIQPNGDFYVTADGLVYIYGAYEIGPYYLGTIEVKLPWIEIEDLLK